MESSIQSLMAFEVSNLEVIEGNAKNDLKWDLENEFSLIKYKIYRSTADESNYALVADNISEKSYTDNNAVNGTVYYYKVIPYSELGQGVESHVSALTGSCKYERLTNSPYAYGAGTPTNPYIICTRDHLHNINLDISASFKLMTDIDLQGEVFIKNVIEYPLYGSVDGNNHVISNFTIDGNSDDYVGFFSLIGGPVSNLTLKNFSITNPLVGAWAVGGLAGEIADVVTNSKVVDFTLNFNCNRAGGFAGHLTAFGHISDSSVVGLTMTNSNNCANTRFGGFVAYTTAGSTITRSSVSGTMDMKGTGQTQFGGFIGESESDISESFSDVEIRSASRLGGFVGFNKGNIDKCVALGNVTSTTTFAAGFIERVTSGNIRKSYSSGNVSSPTTAAGFIYLINSPNSLIENSYALGDVSASNAAGLVAVVSVSGSTLRNSFYGGTITATTAGAGIVHTDASLYLTGTNNYYDSSKNPLPPNASNVSTAQGAGATTAVMQTVPSAIYTGWDFSTIWSQVNGNYPILR